jgi:hypothetical protein
VARTLETVVRDGGREVAVILQDDLVFTPEAVAGPTTVRTELLSLSIEEAAELGELLRAVAPIRR